MHIERFKKPKSTVFIIFIASDWLKKTTRVQWSKSVKEKSYGILELPGSCNHTGGGKELFAMYEQHNSTVAMYGLDLSMQHQDAWLSQPSSQVSFSRMWTSLGGRAWHLFSHEHDVIEKDQNFHNTKAMFFTSFKPSICSMLSVYNIRPLLARLNCALACPCAR